VSFSDTPGLTNPQKAGCALYVLFGGFVSLTAMGGAALGDCVPDGECINETGRAILFYGVPLAVLMGGTLMIRHFMRDKN